MNTIWKFPLAPADVIEVEMPEGAVILAVQTQQEVPCLWAIVDPDAPLEKRTILMMGTGHPRAEFDGKLTRITPEARWKVVDSGYIGTVQMMGGELVFHFFERRH